MPSFPAHSSLNYDTPLKTYIDAGDAAAAASSNPHFLSYDTTGATSGHTALQAAYDAGYRTIIIPEGTFYANAPVFFDAEDGNSTVHLIANGVLFNAGTGLPTCAEFDSFCTTYSRPTGCKFFLFPSTKRTALSGGVVTCTGNYVTGTATTPVTRVGVNPKLVVDGGTFNASALTKYNAGFVCGNRGGAAEIRSVHMSSARTLLTWADYVDGNKMMNCSGWGGVVMDSTYDAAMFYQITNGDAVYIEGVKTDNYILTANMTSCNGALITATVGGGYKFNYCHAIMIVGNHAEKSSDVAGTTRNIYEIKDSYVTIDTCFEYMPESQPTNGAIYLDDSNGEGKHSKVEVRCYHARNWMNSSDPGPGYAVYINQMNDRSRLRFHSCHNIMSAAGSLATMHGQYGIQIGGNATNEPTLAAAINKGRDVIGSGDFAITKSQTSTMSTGQNRAMNIEIVGVGPLANLYRSRAHVTPTFYDAESYGTGTLTASTVYAYAAALCNTLPDGTIQYGAATAEWTQTAPAGGAQGFEMYLPTGAQGATLAIWRKTTSGVLSAPDRYVLIPVGSGSTRLVDTGANISTMPWITTSVPVPNTVAATNHTIDQLYLQGTALNIP